VVFHHIGPHKARSRMRVERNAAKPACPFVDKYQLLRGILDGPIVVGHSTLNPQVQLDSEDEMMKILEGIEMTIRHNHPLLLTLLP
jgi:hypothetical protein